MRTIFVINPAAGQGKGIDKFIEKIRKAGEMTLTDVEIYTTKAIGDGEAFIDSIGKLSKEKEDEIRIIACGGDGTVNEVLNGIMKYENMVMGVVPIGTGNDFVRNFPEAGDFKDVEAVLRGKVVRCDAIRYRGVIGGKEQTRYCANMFNVGFDCNAADMTAKVKSYPMVAGSMAYLLGVAATFVKKKGADLRIEVDGQVCNDGPLLLTSLANGSYCGGGVKSNPCAVVQDGLMDINIVYDVTRREFINLFPKYAKGTHMSVPGIEKILCAKQCKTAAIQPRQGIMRLCVDGEIVDAERVEFECVQAAFRMIVPAK
ncbi:MAG: hypothetical protein IKW01_05850 [Firmicutes bacterium]|nr:hypothetical protein [Bacillota bacterium]